MQIISFPPYYQLVCTNFYFSSFSLISCVFTFHLFISQSSTLAIPNIYVLHPHSWTLARSDIYVLRSLFVLSQPILFYIAGKSLMFHCTEVPHKCITCRLSNYYICTHIFCTYAIKSSKADFATILSKGFNRINVYIRFMK